MVLIMVMVSGVYTYLSTHQVVCINYGQLFVCQAYLNKMVEIKYANERKNLYIERHRDDGGREHTGPGARRLLSAPSSLPQAILPSQGSVSSSRKWKGPDRSISGPLCSTSICDCADFFDLPNTSCLHSFTNRTPGPYH